MTNDIEPLIKQLKDSPVTVEFRQVIDIINANYDYSPTRFTNGRNKNQAVNEAGSNEGSCKIFAFAQLHNLTEQQALHCFGEYYRKDVIEFPNNNDHANIRNFISHGWSGITFDAIALEPKLI